MKKELKLYTLKKSNKLGLTNENLNVNQLHGLLKEELREALIEADKMRAYKLIKAEKIIGNKYIKCRNAFASELLDIIQISIAGLVMLEKEGLDLELLFTQHNFKLLGEREWEPNGVINIDVEGADV